MIELFKTYISEQFKYPLPGIKTHLDAAPYRKADVDELTKKQARQSGVLILFYEKNNILHTVLIKTIVIIVDKLLFRVVKKKSMMQI